MNILGNNFLISIAANADSPSKAAKIAQLFGLSREEVRAVRNAAALKRDQGLETFNKTFEPYSVMDTEIAQCRTMTMKISIDKTYEQRALNAAEFNELADYLQEKLAAAGLRVHINRKKVGPYERSTLGLK